MKHFVAYIRPAIGILLTTFFLSILIYFLIKGIIGYDALSEKSDEKKLDNLTKILGLSISMAGFVSIIITVIQSKQSIEREFQQNSVELFKELRNEEFIKARKHAYLVKNKWFADPDYRNALIEYNFSRREAPDIPAFNQDIKVIYRLMEFYLLVSIYDGNKKVLKALRYFYYGWWRKFLYDFAKQVDLHSQVNPLLKNGSTDYLNNISYEQSLKRLDKLCDLENVPVTEELHYDGG